MMGWSCLEKFHRKPCFFFPRNMGFSCRCSRKKNNPMRLGRFCQPKKLHATETTSDLKLTDHHGDYIAPPKSKTPVNYIPQLHLYRSICLFYLSILSIYLSINQSINQSVYLPFSVYLVLSISINLYLSFSICLFLSVFFYLCRSLSISAYLYLSLSISIYLYLSLSISI